MEKYNNDSPCEFNPRLKAKFDDFLGKCSVLDGKDTGLYALANDVLKEEIKSFFYEANEKHGNAVYSKLLQDNSFRKYIKSAGIDCAFLDRIYMLENSPYDFYPTDSFLEKEKLIEGVYNTLKSIYDRKSPEAKVDCILEEKVKPVIMRNDSACCKTEEADTSPSTPDMHFSDEFSQNELFQSSIGVDATEQVDDNIEKISTENEKEQSQNQVALETNAESQENNESLILKCQNVIFRTLKEDGKTDLSQCDKESCKKIINALKLTLPNGLTIKSSRKKNKRYYTLESIDLNYLKRSHSGSKDNYKKAVRGFISWILQKPLNKKIEEADISPSTPDMHFPDDFSQDELFQSSIGVDATKQVDDNIEKISTENEEEQSRNQVTLETNAESQESNESLILKCQNVIFRTLKEDGKTDLSQCDNESCQKIINALELTLPNGLTIKSNRKKNKYTLESIDLNYSQKSCSKIEDNYLKAIRGFISWILLKPSNKKTDSQASQNDIIKLQTLKYYKAISRIIIAKFGEDCFFYMEGNTPRLKNIKYPSINQFKELIFKLNEDEYLKNKIHIEFSSELNYSYIRIKELGIYLHHTQQYSNGDTKKKRSKISKLIWRFYKLVLQKSNYFPSSLLNKQ